MSEFDDLSLREAFSQFHTDALTAVPAQDIAGVRAIARRRRITRASMITAMAAVVLAVPVTAYAFVNGPHGPPPAVHPSYSPSPSGSPTPSASPSASATPSAAPDGKISLKDLGNATLDIPAWPADSLGAKYCPAKRQKFTDGTAPGSDPAYGHTAIRNVAYADVDHDGAQETVALVDCVLQGMESQVVVFDRDGSGNIVTSAQVLTEDKVIRYVFAVRGEADGSVSVQVGDLAICCSTTPDMVEHQWRTYAWNGERFAQTAGPTAFHPATQANDLAMTTSVTGLAFGPVQDGVRKATLSVKVSNNGPARAPGLRLDISASVSYMGTADLGQKQPGLAPLRLATVVPGCRFLTAPDPTLTSRTFPHIECHLAGLAAGASRVYTFTLASPTGNDAILHTQFYPQHRWEPFLSADLNEEQPGIRMLFDPHHDDNSLVLSLTRVD